MSVPIILFEVCFSLREEIGGLEDRCIELPVVLVQCFGKAFNCRTFSGTMGPVRIR